MRGKIDVISRLRPQRPAKSGRSTTTLARVLGLLLALDLVSGAANARAETVEDAGLWTMIAGQGSIPTESDALQPLRWWFDGQARFSDDTDGFGQSIVRPGLGYALTEAIVVWAGYAWIRTEPAGSSVTDEHRIWQQLTWATRWDRLSFLSRSRLEQRFVSSSNDVGWRARQFVKASYPLGSALDLRLVGYDEIFFNLNSPDFGAEAGFDQNRFFAGLAIPLGSASKTVFEIGYLNQFVRAGSGNDRMNHILSFNLLLSF